MKYIFLVLGAVLTVKRFAELNTQDTRVSDFFEAYAEYISASDPVYVDERLSQDLIFEFIKYNSGDAELVKDYPEKGEDFIYFGPGRASGTAVVLGCLGEGKCLIYGGRK